MSGSTGGSTIGSTGGSKRGAELRLLSGGAAQGVASALMHLFFAETGAEVRATFQAVGALREKLLAGEPCDVFISTRAMFEELALAQHIVADTIMPLGSVHTAIALRAGDRIPAIARRDELRATLAAATAIYVPDPERATAGIHFVRMLRTLRLHERVVPHLRTYPSGTLAMAALARSPEGGCIGCTQVTEINATPGVKLVGPLPGEFELATVYAVGVCAKTPQPALARRFARLISGPESLKLRIEAGFEL
jgi:molybdate transport system substrate-binding protein